MSTIPAFTQVGRQNAAECVPLIMEPKSAYYKSPLLVLDFQSLYPSIMIAYNYCYSTCLGRVGTFRGQRKFGVLEDFELPDGLLGSVDEHINSTLACLSVCTGTYVPFAASDSRAERDHVCQTQRSQKPLSEDVDGAAGHTYHGQAGYEDR